MIRSQNNSLLEVPFGDLQISDLPATSVSGIGQVIQFSLVIPTYKESDNIKNVITRLSQTLDEFIPGNYELIVVDDDSPDRTWEVALSLIAEYPQLRVMRRQHERGLSTAVIRGWQVARGSILGVIDGDLQHPPHMLQELLREIQNGADLAVASRHVEGGGVSSWSFARRFLSRGAQLLGLIILPEVLSRVSDPMSGSFLVRRNSIANVTFNPVGYKILLEVIGRGKVNQIAEASYVFCERKEGESKVTWKQYVDYIHHLIRLRLSTGRLIRVSNAINSYLPLIAITILGALLRFHELGKEPLWVDEAATWRFAQLPLSQLWGEEAVRETNPPLYYTLQKLWLVFGQSEAALRSLSAIVGTINIPLLYGLGRVLGGHWLGLVASALLATSRINIQYSQEARGYALLTAAATLSIWGLAYLLTLPHKPTVLIGQGLINTLRRNSFSTQAYWNNLTSDLAWIAYIIGVSIALYCHNTAVLLPILANVVVLVWWATKGCFSKKFFLNWSVANVIWILIWSWWIPKIIQQTAVTLSDFWIPYPTIQIFFTTLISLYGSEYYLLLISGLAVLGILYWRHQPTKSGLTVTLSIGTILLGFLISFKRSIFITKIFLWTTIPFFVLVAAGILYFRKRSLIAISIAILIIIQLFFTSKYYKYSKKEPWNEVGFYVQSLVQPKDTILLFPSTIDSAFQYYFHSPKREVTQYGLRRWSFNIPRLPSTKVTEIKRSELLNIVQRFSRIWLVVRNREFEDPQNLAISDIDQKMTQLSQKSFDQKIEIFLFEKNNTK